MLPFFCMLTSTFPALWNVWAIANSPRKSKSHFLSVRCPFPGACDSVLNPDAERSHDHLYALFPSFEYLFSEHLWNFLPSFRNMLVWLELSPLEHRHPIIHLFNKHVLGSILCSELSWPLKKQINETQFQFRGRSKLGAVNIFWRPKCQAHPRLRGSLDG